MKTFVFIDASNLFYGGEVKNKKGTHIGCLSRLVCLLYTK